MQAQPTCKLADVDVTGVDELAAVLGDLAVCEAAGAPAAAAQPLAGLVQLDLDADPVQLVGGGSAGQAGADHGYARVYGVATGGSARDGGVAQPQRARQRATGDQQLSTGDAVGQPVVKRRLRDCSGVRHVRPVACGDGLLAQLPREPGSASSVHCVPLRM